MQWLWSLHESRAIGARSHVGRCAVGVASGHADLRAATGAMSAVRHSHRSDRVRRFERADHATLAATDRGGLSVDADVICSDPTQCQLGEGPWSGARVPARLGRPVRTTRSLVDLSHSRRCGAVCFRLAEGVAMATALNTTIKAVLRRARGMRDEEMVLLKLKWTTARPIRSARISLVFCSLRRRRRTQIGEEPIWANSPTHQPSASRYGAPAGIGGSRRPGRWTSRARSKSANMSASARVCAAADSPLTL